MRDAETFHQPRREYFIVGFLLRRAAAALDQTALSLDDRPFLFQPAVRGIVRRHQVYGISAGSAAEQNIAHILGKRMLEEIDLRPLQVSACGTHPILIREAQAHALFQQRMGRRNAHLFQRAMNALTAGGDGASLPPCVQRGAVNNPFSHRNTHGNMFRTLNLADSKDCRRFTV